MMLLHLAQIDWEKYRPEKLFGSQVLERTPAGLTIVYMIGAGILIGFLILTFLDNFGRPKFLFESDLPREVTKKLTRTVTNRSLRLWEFGFILLAFFVYGFQVYWAEFADKSNQEFQALMYKDRGTRRSTASDLRGWMLDRSGKLSNSLAYYTIGKDGYIDRTYP